MAKSPKPTITEASDATTPEAAKPKQETVVSEPLYDPYYPRQQVATHILGSLLSSPIYANALGDPKQERELVLKAYELADQIRAFVEPSGPQEAPGD